MPDPLKLTPKQIERLLEDMRQLEDDEIVPLTDEEVAEIEKEFEDDARS